VGTTLRTLLVKAQKKTVLKFYNVKPLPVLFYGSESWAFSKQQISRVQMAEMGFLRDLEGYHVMDEKRNEGRRK
jgi:hypothetical protein